MLVAANEYNARGEHYIDINENVKRKCFQQSSVMEKYKEKSLYE